MNQKHILVVDDEARIREVVEYALAREGYRVSSAVDGQQALALAERDEPDLVVLDVMLPEIDGLEVCRQLRRRSRAPVLFLSARGEEVDRIVGLELGGDDYLTKPFSPRELVARVRAILRRVDDAQSLPTNTSDATKRSSDESVLRHDCIEIDFERHIVRCKGRTVELTRTELGVLAALIERPGVVLSRAQLVERGYSDQTIITERTIDTHVRRIRMKFREHGIDPIATVHGVGYKASGA